MFDYKRFLKTSAVFFFGNIVTRVVSFFLLPLYTSHINPEQMGNYDFSYAIIELVAPIAFIRIWDGVFRFSFDYKGKKHKYALINNSLVVCTVGLFVYFILFAVVNKFFSFEHFVLVFFNGLFLVLQYVYTFSARVFLENTLFVCSGLINTIVTIVLNVVLITKFNYGVASLYVSAIIGTVVQILIIESKLNVLKNFKISDINKKKIYDMVKFSIPLCFSTVCYWLLSGYTKLIIRIMLGSYENGVFAVANKFATAIIMVMSVLQYAWNESAYLNAENESRKSFYYDFIWFVTKAIMYGSAALILVVKIAFPFFVDEAYQEALYIVPATILGVAVNSLSDFCGTLFLTEKNTMFLMKSTLFAALINVGCSILGVKLFALHGATVSLAIAFVFLVLLRLIKLKKQFDISMNKSVLISVVALLLGVCCFYFVDNDVVLVGLVFILFLSFLFDCKKPISNFLKNIMYS